MAETELTNVLVSKLNSTPTNKTGSIDKVELC